MRFLFVAYMVLASSMIITWDHGVFAVLMSSLAMEFLFSIDDEIYQVIASMGFEDSVVFCHRLLPALRAFVLIDTPVAVPDDPEKPLPTENLCPEGQPANVQGAVEPKPKDNFESVPPVIARCWPANSESVQRSEMINAGAVLLTTGLFFLHCIQSLQIATNKSFFPDPEEIRVQGDEGNRAKQKDPNAPAYFFQKIFDEVEFRRVAQITAGIFAGGFFIAAVMRVRRPHCSTPWQQHLHAAARWAWPLLRLLQTGLCLIAVYSLIIHCVYYGMLAWYSTASSPGRVGAWVVYRIFSTDAGSFWSAFVLHSAVSCWRAVLRSAPPSPASPDPRALKEDLVQAS